MAPAAGEAAAAITRADLREELANFAAEAFRTELRQQLSEALSHSLGAGSCLPSGRPSQVGSGVAQANPNGEMLPFPAAARFKAKQATSANWSSEGGAKVTRCRTADGGEGGRQEDDQHEWIRRHVRGFTANQESQDRNPNAMFSKQHSRGHEEGHTQQPYGGSGGHGGHGGHGNQGADAGDRDPSPLPAPRRRNKRTETPGAAQLAAARFGLGWEKPSNSQDTEQDANPDLPGQVGFEPFDRQTSNESGTSNISRANSNGGGNQSMTASSRATSEGGGKRLDANGCVMEGSPSSRGSRNRSRQTMRTTTQRNLKTALRREEYSWRDKLRIFVCSIYFDYVSGLLVFANATMLGVQTDYMARNFQLNKIPLFFRIQELFFCAVFTGEILLRIYVYRGYFFQMMDWKWNLFDIVVVSTQVGEEILMLILNQFSDDDSEVLGVASSLTVMRVLRVLRLVRIIRLVRVMRLIGELRTLVMSIVGSMKSLCWAVVLLFLLIYIIGVYFTQIVSDHRQTTHKLWGGDAVDSQLELYYGTLGRTILVLFESVAGGIDWYECLDPLMQEISPWLGVLFSFYIAFVLLAMMNVVTGVFTETALLSAKKDKDIYMVNHVRELFHALDLDRSGMITWNEIEAQMNTSEFQEYFKAIDVDVSEAQGLFKLLDLNDSGEISSEDFLNGCIRIRGPARALETMLLLRETSRMAERQRIQAHHLENLLAAASAAWAAAPGAANGAAQAAVHHLQVPSQGPTSFQPSSGNMLGFKSYILTEQTQALEASLPGMPPAAAATAGSTEPGTPPSPPTPGYPPKPRPKGTDSVE